jgi:hypothetical protein
LTVEESEQQGADMRTIDVRIGHDDNAVITQFFSFKIFFADTGTQRGN